MAPNGPSSSSSSFVSQGQKVNPCPIHGMESVVATVSGYHGSERFRLIKLIAQTGASYVGAMARSTTHLVCWRFEGKKFDMARELGTCVVSHRWFEDCLKLGKRVPEGPYTMQSGREAGPILWELPSACDTRGKQKNPLDKKRNVLSDLSNALEFVEVDKDASNFDISSSDWSVSHLLDELESSSSLPKHSSRGKRNFNNFSGVGCSLGPARRSRRLVKKNLSDNPLNYVIFDSEQTSRPKSIKDNNPVYVDLDNVRNMIEPSVQEISSENVYTNFEGSGRLAPQPNEERGEMINHDPISNSNISNFCALSAPGTSQVEHYDHTQERIEFCDVEDNQNEKGNESGELCEADAHESESGLSCVICFTEYCSTRGVLPCGHRFCFACIQEWADHLASRGKISTCPLCKTGFSYITKYVENVNASSDQKIYSQTIPCGSQKTDILMIPNSRYDRDTWLTDSVCYECHHRDPEDLLISCHICQNRWVHSCCLDPPLIPWTCVRCSDLRSLYQHFH